MTPTGEFSTLEFRFRPTDKVGFSAAEQDSSQLFEAFIDTGELDALRTTTDPRSVVVGRTGIGKTALLMNLERRAGARVLRIDPMDLALEHLERTNIAALVAAGVNLAPFFEFFWRQVFVMELLAHWYDQKTDRTWEGLASKIIPQSLRPQAVKKRQAALEHLREYTSDPADPLAVRSKTVIERFAQKVEAGLKAAGLSAKLSSERDATTTTEFAPRAQSVVNQLALQRTKDSFEFLKDEILKDPQKPYYIVIDELDKQWVDARYMFDLLDALLEVVGEFARIDNVKIVVALRENIVQSLHARQHRSQQREKQEDFFIRLRWSHAELEELADKRLDLLLRGRYGQKVTLSSFLPAPKKGTGGTSIKWLLNRTMSRPRDVIDFLNVILQHASEADATQISWNILSEAERDYSLSRLKALEDEWLPNYPQIQMAFDAFRGTKEGFTIEDLEHQRLDELCREGERAVERAASFPLAVPIRCFQYLDEGAEYPTIWRYLTSLLYRVGALGVKRSTTERIIFVFESGSPSVDSLRDDTRFYVHPGLQRELNVNVVRGDD